MARCRRSLLFRVAEEVRGIMAELGHRTDRAFAPWPVAALHPLPMGLAIACGLRLATDQGANTDAP